MSNFNFATLVGKDVTIRLSRAKSDEFLLSDKVNGRIKQVFDDYIVVNQIILNEKDQTELTQKVIVNKDYIVTVWIY